MLFLLFQHNDSHISNNNNSNTDTRNEVVSEIIYTIHKCILFIGDLSRYRTLIAKTYLPLNSISKEDNNNYSKSIELYKLSLLVLPSLGDPYNHIAIIDNLKDDKFNVVYNFMRSCLTTKPSIIGFNNLINFLSKDPLINPIFKQFEKLNCLNRDKITKNDRLELLKTEFLILLNYYLLPNKWKLKEGYLFKNYKIKDIQNDFLLLLSKLDFHKQIFNDFYLKQLSILLGGFELLIDNNKNHPDLIQDKLIISNYLKFILKYFMNMMKTSINNNKLNIDSSSSQSSDNNNNNSDEKNDSNLQNLSILLLPMIRMMLCWFRERLLPQVFIKTNFEFLKLLSILLNSFLKFVYNNNSLINKITKNNESFNKPPFVINKPKRVRLFKEDITLNEFKPINGCLHDFDDKELYKNDEKLILALIGELPEGINDEIKNYENLLKILAIVHLGKLILNDNKVNIKFNEVTGLFDIPSPPPPQTANTPTPSPSQSQISSTASSSSISLINDNLDSSLFPRNDEIANFGKLNSSSNSGKKQQYNQFSNNSKNYNNNNNINPQLNNTNGHYQNHHINNGKNSNKPVKINNSYSTHTSSSTLSNNNTNRQQNFLNNNNNNRNVTPPQVASSSTTNLFQNTNLGHPQPQAQSSSQLNQPFQQHLNQTLPPHYQQPQHQLLSEEALISNLLSKTLNNGGNNTYSQVIDTNNLNGNTDFTTPSNHNFDINSLTPNSLHYPMFNNSNSAQIQINSQILRRIQCFQLLKLWN
ncbi:unnamed protein product [[Candida] boidinii]|nr:unnamed protein product [[Candida] boidinii]